MFFFTYWTYLLDLLDLLTGLLGEGKKKTEKAVRLTAWVFGSKVTFTCDTFGRGYAYLT